MVQSQFESGQGGEDADHGTAYEIPLEVVEEPARPADHTQLVHDDAEQKDDEQDDGNESTGFLRNVLRRQAVDRNPV